MLATVLPVSARMGVQASPNGMQALTFEAFGVRMGLTVSASFDIARVRRALPPGSSPSPPDDLQVSCVLTANGTSTYELSRDGVALLSGERSADFALERLESELRT